MRFEFVSNTPVDKAKDEIVLALLKRSPPPARERRVEPQESVRLPLVTDRCDDLEAAIDDMMERFPRTLEYLAK